MSLRRFSALLLGAVLMFAAPAQASSQVAAQFSDSQKAQIETIIKDYLINNPAVLEQALQVLQTKIQNDEKDRQTAAISDNMSKLQAVGLAPAAGNLQGTATVVEFFDYRCGYCHAMAPVVANLLKDDSNVRLIYREFPILGPVSVTASKAALAAALQNKYPEMHNALMGSARPLATDDDVYNIAKTLGLDIDRLKKDMEGEAVKAEIANNFQLAESMGIRGTPAFVIGSQMYPGAMDIAGLKNAVSQARLATGAAATGTPR